MRSTTVVRLWFAGYRFPDEGFASFFLVWPGVADGLTEALTPGVSAVDIRFAPEKFRQLRNFSTPRTLIGDRDTTRLARLLSTVVVVATATAVATPAALPSYLGPPESRRTGA